MRRGFFFASARSFFLQAWTDASFPIWGGVIGLTMILAQKARKIHVNEAVFRFFFVNSGILYRSSGVRYLCLHAGGCLIHFLFFQATMANSFLSPESARQDKEWRKLSLDETRLAPDTDSLSQAPLRWVPTSISTAVKTHLVCAMPTVHVEPRCAVFCLGVTGMELHQRAEQPVIWYF
jgi:hypothetical protein